MKSAYALVVAATLAFGAKTATSQPIESSRHYSIELSNYLSANNLIPEQAIVALDDSIQITHRRYSTKLQTLAEDSARTFGSMPRTLEEIRSRIDLIDNIRREVGTQIEGKYVERFRQFEAEERVLNTDARRKARYLAVKARDALNDGFFDKYFIDGDDARAYFLEKILNYYSSGPYMSSVELDSSLVRSFFSSHFRESMIALVGEDSTIVRRMQRDIDPYTLERVRTQKQQMGITNDPYNSYSQYHDEFLIPRKLMIYNKRDSLKEQCDREIGLAIQRALIPFGGSDEFGGSEEWRRLVEEYNRLNSRQDVLMNIFATAHEIQPRLTGYYTNPISNPKELLRLGREQLFQQEASEIERFERLIRLLN